MNKRLTILVLIATMVFLGFVGGAMATKPLKLKGEVDILNFAVDDPDGNRIDFSGTARFIIHRMFDSNGGLAKLHINFGVDGEAQDKDYKIRGAFNEKFDVDPAEDGFQWALTKTFTCIPAGEGASFKVDLTATVRGNISKTQQGVDILFSRHSSEKERNLTESFFPPCR